MTQPHVSVNRLETSPDEYEICAPLKKISETQLVKENRRLREENSRLREENSRLREENIILNWQSMCLQRTRPQPVPEL